MSDILNYYPDYAANPHAAKTLVARLKKYYADQGYNVNVWIETRDVPDINGKSAIRYYDIRSSLKFKIPK